MHRHTLTHWIYNIKMVRFPMEKPQPHIHNIVLILNLDENGEKKILYVWCYSKPGNAFYCFSIYSFTHLLGFGEMCKMCATHDHHHKDSLENCELGNYIYVRLQTYAIARRLGRPERRIFQCFIIWIKGVEWFTHTHASAAQRWKGGM